MMEIDDIFLGIRQAKDIATEQAVSPEAFIRAAYKLNIRMFIRIPTNDVDTFLLGTSNRRMMSTFTELACDNWPFDYERPIQVSGEHEYLCLDPNDYKLIAQKIKISKSNFSNIGVYQEGTGLTNLSPTDFVRRLTKSKPGITYITGSFRTFEKNKISPRGVPSHEKLIDLSFAELLIAPQDISKLSAELEPDASETASKPFQWMSDWLRDLNELHVYFFPPENKIDETLSHLTREKIDKILRRRWVSNDKNEALFMQAAFATLPDNLYKDSPGKEKLTLEIQNQFMNYTSTALLLINQGAKKFWEDKQKASDKKYPKRETIVGELRKLGLTANLSASAAKIIRPDSEQRIPSFRKGSSRK